MSGRLAASRRETCYTTSRPPSAVSSLETPVLEDKIIIYRGKQVLAFVEGDTMRAPLFADLFDEERT